MGLTVTLTGARHTDGTEGRLSLTPRSPWVVSSGANMTAPGPLYFKITPSGTLTTLGGAPAVVVPTYDSSTVMGFVPSGSSYLVSLNISGQQLVETWTIDGAADTVNWAALGVKPNASDKVTVSLPMTTESPVPHYPTVASLPVGSFGGRMAFVAENDGFYGHNGSAWVRLD